jgi:hypothetical protein
MSIESVSGDESLLRRQARMIFGCRLSIVGTLDHEQILCEGIRRPTPLFANSDSFVNKKSESLTST